MAQFSEQDLIQLNSYLDGRLTSNERAALETRLARDVALRTELESLRDTIGLLKMAERVPVPRSFTLDSAAFARQSRLSLWDRLGLTSIPGWAYAGASLAVVMIIGALVLGSLPAGTPAAAPMVAMEAPAPTEVPMEESAAEMAAPATEAPAEATEETMFSFLAESETPGADSAMPPMPTGAASKMGDGTPPEGVGGMGGEPGSGPAGMGGGPVEGPSPMPQPTEAPMVAQSGTGEPEAASSAAQAAADRGGEGDGQEPGVRNYASEPATEGIIPAQVTEAKPFDFLKESSWALLLGGTVLLVVIVLVVTVITRRR